MAARKTIEVASVKKTANMMLGLKGPEFTRQYREAVIALIESVLHTSHNYKGFKYRYSEWDVERHELKKNYDPTRREYY